MAGLLASELTLLETRLITQRSQLLRNLRSHLHNADNAEELGLPHNIEELGDEALADAMNDVDLALLKHEFAELRTIQAALARIAAGDYGVCAGCGEPIPAPRLHAQPAALYCLACQSQLERHLGASSAAPA